MLENTAKDLENYKNSPQREILKDDRLDNCSCCYILPQPIKIKTCLNAYDPVISEPDKTIKIKKNVPTTNKTNENKPERESKHVHKTNEKCVVCDSKDQSNKSGIKRKKMPSAFSQFNLELTSSELIHLLNKSCFPESYDDNADSTSVIPETTPKKENNEQEYTPGTLEAHFIDLKKDVKMLTSKTEELGKQNERTKSELMSKEDQIANLIIRITLLLEALGKKDINNDRLKDALNRAEFRNEALKKQICDCRTKIDELTTENQQIQDRKSVV